MISEAELTSLWQRVEVPPGWDFSALNLVGDEPPWKYDDIVRRHAQPHFLALDLGTGSGESLRPIVPSVAFGLGIDWSDQRLDAARTTPNAGFALMNARELALREASFDLVLAKYADYRPEEVWRVLRPGGVFITLQMGDRTMQTIYDAFHWDSHEAFWRRLFEQQGTPYVATVETAAHFRELGCEVITYDECDFDQYLVDLESLVLLLKATPLPAKFDPHEHIEAFNELLRAESSERGVRVNSHRELLVVKR